MNIYLTKGPEIGINRKDQSCWEMDYTHNLYVAGQNCNYINVNYINIKRWHFTFRKLQTYFKFCLPTVGRGGQKGKLQVILQVDYLSNME